MNEAPTNLPAVGTPKQPYLVLRRGGGQRLHVQMDHGLAASLYSVHSSVSLAFARCHSREAAYIRFDDSDGTECLWIGQACFTLRRGEAKRLREFFPSLRTSP